MLTIIVTHEGNKSDRFEFGPEQSSITLGRRTSNDVCIPDLSVSGTHATLTLKDGNAFLKDLDSTNGSYVNGEVIGQKAVSSGDEIILGKIQLHLTIDEPSVVPKAATQQAQEDNIAQAPVEPVAPTAKPAPMPSSANATTVQDAPASARADQTDDDLATLIRPVTANVKEATASHLQASAPANTQTSSQSHPLEGLEHKVIPSAAPATSPMHELDSSSNTSKGAVIEIKNGAKSGQILPIDKPVTTLGRPGIQIAAIMRKPDGYFLMHIESDDKVSRPTLNSDTVGDEPLMLHSGDALTVAGIEVEFMLS